LSLLNNTTGSSNTAIGKESLYTNTTGNYNTSNGVQSLLYNTTGSNNIAIGGSTLLFNTTGSNNSATGTQSLYYNTTGDANTANGVLALYANTTGGGNTAIGTQSLYSNTTASNNTGLGSQSLFANSTGHDNVGIGRQSLSANTTGNYNTAIGPFAGGYLTTGGYNTIIGGYAGTAAMANNVVLSDGFGNIRFQYNGTNTLIGQSGNVGIGTTSPLVKLQSSISTSGLPATSGTTQTNGALRISSSATSGVLDFGINGSNNWIQSTDNTDLSQGYNLLLNPRGGNVGIGLTNPQGQLHINQEMVFSEVGYDTVRLHKIQHQHSDGSSVNNNIRFLVSDGSGTTAERMRINGAGSVLVGTTSDNGNGIMQVNGNITFAGNITNYGTGTGTYTRGVWYYNSSDGIIFDNARTTDSSSGTGRTVYFTWRGGPSVGGGVQLIHGTNTWAPYTSDARLKTIVANVEDGIDAIMKLKPVKYKWTKELEKSITVLGFTAQNVGEAIPEAMFKSWKDEELGDVLSYRPEFLTPYLVKAIQELKAELDALKNN